MPSVKVGEGERSKHDRKKKRRKEGKGKSVKSGHAKLPHKTGAQS